MGLSKRTQEAKHYKTAITTTQGMNQEDQELKASLGKVSKTLSQKQNTNKRA
jgi:hypothetical protein